MSSEYRDPNAPTYIDNEFRQIFRNLYYADRVRGLDVDKWVKYCKQAGAGLVFVDVKTQAFALYDTALIPKDPALGGRDLAAEVARAAKKHGVKWGAYIPPSTVESLYAGHDDWQQRQADGTPEAKNWGWWRTVFCYNSGFKDHFAGMLHEIAEKYRPHAFYIDDLIFGFSACFCRTCAEKFRRETGHALPLAPDWKSPVWFAYLAWRYRQMEEAAKLIHDAVHSVDPRIAVVWNCKVPGSGWYSGQIHQGRWLDYPCVEFLPTGWWGEFKDKYTYAEELAWAFTVDRSLRNGHLAHFYTYLVPEARLAEAVTSYDTALAFGAQPCAQEHCRHMRTLLRRVKQVDPYLVDMASAADVALHFSETAHNAYYQPGDFTRDRPFYAECRGVFKGLLNNHVPVEVVSDEWLERTDLGRFRAVILPNSVALTAPAVERLQAYVQGGGALIASLETGLRDDQGRRTGDALLWPGLGLRFKGDIETAKAVCETFTADGRPEVEADIPASPDQFLVFGKDLPAWLGEDIRLGRRFDGIERREMQQFAEVPSCHLPTTAIEVEADRTWDVAVRLRFRRSKAAGWAECPAVCRRAYGKGSITYVNFQVGTLVSKTGHPWWRALIRKLLRDAAGTGAVRVQAPVCLKYYLWKQPAQNRYVIHLVNELSSVGQQTVQREDHVPVPAKLTIALPGVTGVRQVAGNTGATIKRVGRTWRVEHAGIRERCILVCRC